jgi:SHS2 domain-containing protein
MKIRYTGIAMDANIGYREIEHTADWELRVWAPDLSALLKTAAEGMYRLSHTDLAQGPRQTREFELPYLDRESLLVDFLSELLFFGEDEALAFDAYQLDFDGSRLKVRASGAPIRVQAKEIKAVTFHGLQIRETDRGLEVNIVFDV